MIYLDNAATTFPKPESVYRAMDEAARNFGVNAGRGSYSIARKATELIDKTKQRLNSLVNSNGKVVFTPSITIALNEILQGVPFERGDNVYISPYEHNAVARVLHLLEQTKGINVILMPVIEDTLEIDLDQLKYMFSQQRPRCVCCIHVSNVTGYVLPIEEIFEVADKYDAVTVLDTAQSLGLVAIDATKLQLDYLAFAGHKTLYGPFGVGGFIELRGNKLNPVIVGGTGSNSLNLEMPSESPNRFESSSPNIVAIAGLYAAMEALHSEENLIYERELLNYLIEQMKEIDEVEMYIPAASRETGILAFNLRGYQADEVGRILDQDYDIAVRTGYHCAPYIHKYLGDAEYVGCVRVGLSIHTSREDIDSFVEAIKELIE